MQCADGSRKKRRSFTLIELIVVLAVIAVATSVAVASFRGDSPSVTLQNGVLELEAWCASLRYRAAESGRDFVVNYEEGGAQLTGGPDYSAQELESFAQDGELTRETHRWLVPARCTIATDDDAERDLTPGASQEIFRFYADGGAQAVHPLLLKCGKFAKRIDFSFLNGRIIIADADAGETP